MNESPPYMNPPPKRTGWIVCSIIVTFLLFVSLLINGVLLALLVGGGHGAESAMMMHRARFQEDFLQGDTDSRNKIAVIYLTGVISSFEGGGASEEGIVGDISEQLRQAREDHNVKAIILRINSPGGEVVASDAIYKAVVEARESSPKKPIIASMDSVAASGAFYVAMGADYVMANDMTITGSIGVIMETLNFTGLMDKVGVKSFTFKSGRYKDLLNPTREPNDEEKALVQDMVMEVYEKFVGIVAKERTRAGAKDMTVESLKTGLADGRIFSGKQAEEENLIDGLGYFDDAVDKAKELAKIKKAKVVRYFMPFSFSNIFRFLGEAPKSKIQVEISPNKLKLEAGKLYFMPAYMFQ